MMMPGSSGGVGAFVLGIAIARVDRTYYRWLLLAAVYSWIGRTSWPAGGPRGTAATNCALGGTHAVAARTHAASTPSWLRMRAAHRMAGVINPTKQRREDEARLVARSRSS